MKLQDLQQLSAYEVIENRDVKDLNSAGFLCRHKKTGARIVILSNEDNNKVFCIGFRTPPENSTGVAHIIEHSVLCGSKRFPAKDPFVELVKGSLNTFLNAMTYPDKTVYPVASCNDKDFQNLMHVYLDAVFYPNIYQEKKIFMQEGWHYELERPEDELHINGVVYNEMKGAFSSPDDVLDREVFNSLFPDTPYGVESGGDPQVIPELSYEEFLDFHRKYYHPSNSYIYLYGDMDMVEKLEFLDREYLDKFENLQIDSGIAMQAAFREPVEVHKKYSITEAESEKDNTYLSYNTVVGTSLEQELYMAFQILDYALCSAPGAPLKEALIDAGIGKEVYSVYENGIYQPYFSIVAKSANVEDQEKFVSIIESVLREQMEKGLDKKALQAGENYYEFKYREADYGSYPKGLMYGLQAFDSWLYDDRTPFMHIESSETFRSIKEKINTDYFETLIGKYLLENTHKAIIVVEPEKGLTTAEDESLQQKLNAYKASLSEEQIQQIVSDTKALLQYQEEPSTEEALATIPVLKRTDIEPAAEPFINRVEHVKDMTYLYHDVFTNGIGYVRLVFDMSHLPKELVPYLGLLKSILCFVDTAHYKYGALFNEINIWTGGISSQVATYVNANDMDTYKVTYELKCSLLFENMEKAFALIEEILCTSNLEDEKRLLEIISEQKSRMQASMTSAGHSLAAIRAMSYFSETAAFTELINGIPFYRLLEDLESHFQERKTDVMAKLKELMCIIFRPENLMVDYTATAGEERALPELVQALRGKLHTEPVDNAMLQIPMERKNEGFTTSSQVQYVCRAGNFIKHGLPYTGALRVLKVIMGYDYLWTNVRVKGGAYGCMCSFGRTGDSYFVSYRDPNLKKTVDIYEGAAAHLRHFQADEKAMTKFIIGTISDMDTPMNPAAKGSRSLSAYLTNLDLPQVQKERDEILSATEADIQKLADYMQAFMSDDCICVVGNEDKIKEDAALFDHVENLFH
ncbi:MAG: insulinase family protein [Lachnospiraceae bacterium]|nr:insulinase family protein [Lachnospiraceae bacterium]